MTVDKTLSEEYVKRVWPVVAPIWQYENSIELPDRERVTFVDANRHIHLKAGDEHAAEYQAYADKCEEYLRFGDEVDEATCGAYDRYQHLKICDTPQVLLNAGFKQKPMLYTQRHLEEALQPKNEENYHCHGLSIAQVKRFPELFESPVLLCDSPSRNDALLVVLCSVDSDSLPLIAAIKPDGRGNYELQSIETNMVLSVYGKNDFELYFQERIPTEHVIYFNKEKSRELERFAKIQFPGNYSTLDSDTIIRRPACLVNAEQTQPTLAKRQTATKNQVSQDAAGKSASPERSVKPDQNLSVYFELQHTKPTDYSL